MENSKLIALQTALSEISTETALKESASRILKSLGTLEYIGANSLECLTEAIRHDESTRRSRRGNK